MGPVHTSHSLLTTRIVLPAQWLPGRPLWGRRWAAEYAAAASAPAPRRQLGPAPTRSHQHPQLQSLPQHPLLSPSWGSSPASPNQLVGAATCPRMRWASTSTASLCWSSPAPSSQAAWTPSSMRSAPSWRSWRKVCCFGRRARAQAQARARAREGPTLDAGGALPSGQRSLGRLAAFGGACARTRPGRPGSSGRGQRAPPSPPLPFWPQPPLPPSPLPSPPLPCPASRCPALPSVPPKH